MGIKTLSDLRTFSFKDSKFVRFLKENGVFSDYIRAINKNDERTLGYQTETINNRPLRNRFFKERDFFLDAFPYGIGFDQVAKWSKLEAEWGILVRRELA